MVETLAAEVPVIDDSYRLDQLDALHAFEPLALALHDPRDRHRVAGLHQLAHDEVRVDGLAVLQTTYEMLLLEGLELVHAEARR